MGTSVTVSTIKVKLKQKRMFMLNLHSFPELVITQMSTQYPRWINTFWDIYKMNYVSTNMNELQLHKIT